jgi:hypothetical protein
LELTLSFVFLFVMILWGLRLGWKSRLRRQAHVPELPAVPARLGGDLAPPLTGMYIGTTIAMHWQDRIVAHTLGQRANAKIRLTHQGIIIVRAGSGPIFIPNGSLIDARLEAAIAGKVVGKGGVLVFRWRHGELEFDTGVRSDDRAAYVPWIRVIGERAPVTESEATP